MTFKELLNQCNWEDLEDFLYEFPDVGMDEGRWKMEGFRRMYDELRRMTPQASEQKIQLRKPKEKGCDYPALFTRPVANSGYLSACSWAEYLGQEVVPPKGMELPPAALVAACMCGMSEFGYTDQECEEAYRRLAEHHAEDSVVKYDLNMDIYDNPTRPIKKRLMRRIRDYHTGFDIPAWDELPTQSRICHISFSHYSWDDAQDGVPKRLEMIPKQLCEYQKFWILVAYTDHALWATDQQFLQNWIGKYLPPQAEIHFLAQQSQSKWDRIISSGHVDLTIVAGR